MDRRCHGQVDGSVDKIWAQRCAPAWQSGTSYGGATKPQRIVAKNFFIYSLNRRIDVLCGAISMFT
jgi:hypothetical protein